MKSQFGNYVIQKAIETCMKRASPLLKEQLLPELRKRLPEIVDKKLRNKWDLIIREAD
jgi:hypothetical protein